MTTKDHIENQYFPALDTPVKRMMALRRASGTKRFHTWPTLTTQSVDQHSYGATLIAMYLEPDASANLLKAVLYHDLAEYHTGDIPATSKRMSPHIGAHLAVFEQMVEEYLAINVILDEHELLVLKLSDSLEGMFFALEDRRLGNSNMDAVMKNYALFVGELICGKRSDVKSRAKDLAHALLAEYRCFPGVLIYVDAIDNP